MKVLALVVFVCAGSIYLFAAPEASEVTLSPPVFTAAVSPFRYGYRFTDRSVESTTCYKMRAYYVIRDSRKPDVTRPDGYSTCQPAARFQVKRAIGQGTERGMTNHTPAETESILPQ